MVATEMPLRAELDEVLRASALQETLGIRLVDWSPGRAEVALTPGAELGNLAGTAHGGVLFSLADAAFEIACNSFGRRCVALETSCHYVSAAPLGEPLSATAQEISRSRRVASYRIEVRGDGGARGDGGQGPLRAWYMALAFRTERWHLGEERWPEDWRAEH